MHVYTIMSTILVYTYTYHTHAHIDYMNTYTCAYFHEHNTCVHVLTHTHDLHEEEHTIMLVTYIPLCMCILS